MSSDNTTLLLNKDVGGLTGVCVVMYMVSSQVQKGPMSLLEVHALNDVEREPELGAPGWREEQPGLCMMCVFLLEHAVKQSTHILRSEMHEYVK